MPWPLPATAVGAKHARAPVTGSFLLHTGNLDRFAPHRNVGGNHGSELDRSIAERVNAEGGKTFGEFRVLDRAENLFRDPVDRLLGQLRAPSGRSR